MQQNIRQSLVFLIIGAIALVGLSSCSITSTSPTSKSTRIESNTGDSPIKAGSSSSTVNFLQILTTAYAATSETEEVNILEPGQSENIIAGVKQGLLNIGTISRSLKPEENDETINFSIVATDALVVATHPSVTGVTNLTTEELKGIYSGAITNWQELGGPEAEIQLLDRPEDESAKRLLREYYLGQDLPSSPNAIVLREETELIQTLQSTPYSIGTFSLAYAISQDLTINRLSLNDIAATVENLKRGQYPMARTIGMIWNKNPSPATLALIDYIFSPAGANIMEQAGFAPVSQSTESEGQ